MLDKMHYINSNNERIDFGINGIYANYNELRDYEWVYQVNGTYLSSFEKIPKTKTFPVVFVCDRKRRNEFFRIVETDVKKRQAGKLYYNGYYLNCFFIATENKDYLRYADFIKTDWTLLCIDSDWHKEETFSFDIQGQQTDGIDYPYDYPHDYGTYGTSGNFENHFEFDSNFRLTIYGAAIEPTITIGGHVYKMNCDIESGQKIIINSMDKTIKLILADGSEVNYFDYRNKEDSIFEPIKAGISSVDWDGSFMFDITLIDSRSEPVWEVFKDDPTPAPEPTPTPTPEPSGEYLLDYSGDYILDYSGNRIEVPA